MSVCVCVCVCVNGTYTVGHCDCRQGLRRREFAEVGHFLPRTSTTTTSGSQLHLFERNRRYEAWSRGGGAVDDVVARHRVGVSGPPIVRPGHRRVEAVEKGSL